jgi:hypothetical protein
MNRSIILFVPHTAPIKCNGGYVYKSNRVLLKVIQMITLNPGTRKNAGHDWHSDIDEYG